MGVYIYLGFSNDNKTDLNNLPYLIDKKLFTPLRSVKILFNSTRKSYYYEKPIGWYNIFIGYFLPPISMIIAQNDNLTSKLIPKINQRSIYKQNAKQIVKHTVKSNVKHSISLSVFFKIYMHTPRKRSKKAVCTHPVFTSVIGLY